MVCSESELRLVELFTFPGETKSLERSDWVNLHGAAHLITFAKKKIISRSKTALVLARI